MVDPPKHMFIAELLPIAMTMEVAVLEGAPVATAAALVSRFPIAVAPLEFVAISVISAPLSHYAMALESGAGAVANATAPLRSIIELLATTMALAAASLLSLELLLVS